MNNKILSAILLVVFVSLGACMKKEEGNTNSQDNSGNNGSGNVFGIFQLPSASEIEEGIPDECELPAGIEVVSISLDEGQEGEIVGGSASYDVTVELNQVMPANQNALICFVVRDYGTLSIYDPIGYGFGIVLRGEGPIEEAASFTLACSDGDIVGAQPAPYDGLNDTTGERQTRVFVQHVTGVSSIADIPTGVQGEKSNRIQVSCPRT
ncbi:MAG: hypothetical protein AAGA21_11855 [Pseudomonadota bacterium]